MKVSGFNSHASVPGTRATSPWKRDSGRRAARVRRASSSTSQKPALWRVASYFLPGLPRPTMSFIQPRKYWAVGPRWGKGGYGGKPWKVSLCSLSAEARARSASGSVVSPGCSVDFLGEDERRLATHERLDEHQLLVAVVEEGPRANRVSTIGLREDVHGLVVMARGDRVGALRIRIRLQIDHAVTGTEIGAVGIGLDVRAGAADARRRDRRADLRLGLARREDRKELPLEEHERRGERGPLVDGL